MNISQFLTQCIAEVHRERINKVTSISPLIKECLIEVLTENLTEGFDPLSNAGPNSPQENPYPIWNNKMRNLEESEPTPELSGYESSKYDLYNWHKRGQKVQVKFFNNKTGTNDVQSGVIREPQKTQAIIRLDVGFKSVVVPWKSITPFMPDPQFGVNEIHPPGQYDAQGTGAVPLSSTFTEVNNEDPTGKPYASKNTDAKDYIPTISIIKWAVQYLGNPEFESRVTQLLAKANVSSEEKVAHCIEFVAREALNQRKMQPVNEQLLPQSTSINWKCPHCSGVTKILLEIESPADYISCSECDHCGKEINDPYLDNRIYEEVISQFASRKILK